MCNSDPLKSTTEQRSAPEPLKSTPPKAYGAKIDESVLREEETLPLNIFEGAGGSVNVKRELKRGSGKQDERDCGIQAGLRSLSRSDYKPTRGLQEVRLGG